jgi:spore germination protein YaaH
MSSNVGQSNKGPVEGLRGAQIVLLLHNEKNNQRSVDSAIEAMRRQRECQVD